MFGNDVIIGRKTAELDNKNRTSIPHFSGVELNDKLLLIEDEDGFSIYEKKYYIKKMEEIETKIAECTDINKLKNLKKILEFEYMKILKEITCDKQGRVVLCDEVPKKIIFYGCGDHLKIKKMVKENNE